MIRIFIEELEDLIRSSTVRDIKTSKVHIFSMFILYTILYTIFTLLYAHKTRQQEKDNPTS